MNNNHLTAAIVCALLVVLFVSGCVMETPELDHKPAIPIVTEVPITKAPIQKTIRLEVEPTIEKYFLGGYTGEGYEAFYVLPGDLDDIKKSLETILNTNKQNEPFFQEDEILNLVVFRGVFSTGGHGIEIDKVEKAGNTFIVYATYTDPGSGMMLSEAFTQPTAIIPIGKQPKGDYIAKLKLTKILRENVGDSILEESKEYANIEFKVS